MKTIRISPLSRKVLEEHNIPVDVYNQLDKYEKIAFITQLRRWGRVSSPHLSKAYVWAALGKPVA
jgi:hypothetical protein